MNYSEAFSHATGVSQPYGYQCRLACGPDADLRNETSLRQGAACTSQLIEIPTGLGKTAGVVLAWLWNRVLHPSKEHRDSWPRRLVYCLPMRTLVEQTRDNVRDWLENLWKHRETLQLSADRIEALRWLSGDGSPEHPSHSPVILMGGEFQNQAERGWDIYPERDAILIGTQDMLLSRALNRGYGMSRYRWPMHFGLLNNDCLWVMDETQLMGPALWTSAQLDWMREDRFRSLLSCKTWWMSATASGDFLETSDRQSANFPKPEVFSLGDEPSAAVILEARRPCAMWTPTALSEKKRAKGKKTDSTKLSPGAEFSQALASAVIEQHQSGTLSLVVCNTVATAQAIFQNIHAAADGKVECILLTSRFRPCDRRAALEKLVSFEKQRKKGDCDHSPGLICISTQVVEAGADISAVRLWSEIAPWPSIIQRLGRLNRDGRDNAHARALFFRVPSDTKPKKGGYVGPYSVEAVTTGERLLSRLVALSEIQPRLPTHDALRHLQSDQATSAEIADALRPVPAPYPRAIDVHGLFSTEPDVFGGFTDISPFVRDSGNSADVTVFWRADRPTQPFPSEELSGPAFDPTEGCTVPVFRLREFLSEHSRAFHWDPDVSKWLPLRNDEICPGMVIMLPASAGGYNRAMGWTGNRNQQLDELSLPGPFSESRNADRFSETGEWLPLDQHLEETRTIALKIAADLPLHADLESAITAAAALHDIGKALPQWQDAIPGDRPDTNTIWAKFVSKPDKHFKPNCRHEAASALALWHRYFYEGANFPALTIYLTAAHHGKVRTVLSSWNGDGNDVCGVPLESPPLPWGGGMPMDFRCALDGAEGEFSPDGTQFFYSAPGWTALIADLLGSWKGTAEASTSTTIRTSEPTALGPFKLAYLEAVIRSADQIASCSSLQTA